MVFQALFTRGKESITKAMLEDILKIKIKDLLFEEKINYYKNKSIYQVNMQNIEKVVKLSTCSYLNNRNRITNQRYYIVANIREM